MIRREASYYIDGTSARVLDYDVYEDNQYLKQKKSYRKNTKLKFKLIVSVILLFIIGFTVIYRYVQVLDINNRISSLYEKYESISQENSQMKINIEKKTDLDEVKRIAQEQLGMKSPTSNQIVYVKVDGRDRTLLSEEYRGQKKETAGSSMFAVLLENVRRLSGLLY